MGKLKAFLPFSPIFGYNNTMDNEAFIQQFERDIEALVAGGKLEEAFEKCKDILQKFPNEKALKKIKKSIEEKLLYKNKQKVKINIKEAKRLFKQGETEQALRLIKDTLVLSPNNEDLKDLYRKFQEAYKEKLEETEKEFIKKQYEHLKKLIDEDQYPQFIQAVDRLESENKSNKNIQKLIKDVKAILIEKEIKNKKDLLDSEKFEDIENFIQGLENIDADSEIVKNLRVYIKRRKMGSQIEDVEEFIYAGENNLVTLMKLKKYEEAMQVCEEILQTDPNNRAVIRIYKKAKRKAFYKSRSEAVRNILLKLPALKAEYKQNKENFIRI
jgi:tetratricopeptide (TPR) repeat protein